MKRTILYALLLLTTLSIASCNDNKAVQAETTETAEVVETTSTNNETSESESARLEQAKEDIDSEIIEHFLSSIYAPGGATMIFEDSWIYKHCSSKMQQTLRDEYEYEGEGWGSWLIGGWGCGEDLETKVTSIKHEGSYYYVTLVPTGESREFASGERILRFDVELINNTPVINDCKWMQDLDYID